MKNLFDWESCRVWLATIFAGGLTLAQINGLLTAVMILSTIIYTWVKILRKDKRDDDE